MSKTWSFLRLAAFMTVAIPVAGHAATPDYMPPAGYYRVDIDSTFPGSERTSSRQTVDGASGTSTRTTGNVTSRYPGAAPNNICLKPDMSPNGLLPPAACPYRGPEVRNGVATFRADCREMKGTMTMRKIDARTWEIASTMTTHDASGVESDLATFKAQLQRDARSTDPQTREAAQRDLAGFEEYAAEARASDAQAGGATTFRMRYTRIADRCAAPAAK